MSEVVFSKLSSDYKEYSIVNEFGYCFYCTESGFYPFIFNLYIHKEYRGLGHSREMLQYIINEIRKDGYNGDIAIKAIPQEDCMSIKDLTEYYKRLGLMVVN